MPVTMLIAAVLGAAADTPTRFSLPLPQPALHPLHHSLPHPVHHSAPHPLSPDFQYSCPTQCILHSWGNPDCSTELRAISHRSAAESFHTCAATAGKRRGMVRVVRVVWVSSGEERRGEERGSEGSERAGQCVITHRHAWYDQDRV